MVKRGWYRGRETKAAEPLTTEELRLRAEQYCALTEHCVQEVREKITAWGGTAAAADEIVAALYEGQYIDDNRYCRAYAHDKLLYQGWGRTKIRLMLQAKGLPREAVAEAIEGIDAGEYRRVLLTVAEKKRNATPEQRLRFLLQRGFAYREIQEALGELTNYEPDM